MSSITQPGEYVLKDEKGGHVGQVSVRADGTWSYTGKNPEHTNQGTWEDTGGATHFFGGTQGLRKLATRGPDGACTYDNDNGGAGQGTLHPKP